MHGGMKQIFNQPSIGLLLHWFDLFLCLQLRPKVYGASPLLFSIEIYRKNTINIHCCSLCPVPSPPLTKISIGNQSLVTA